MSFVVAGPAIGLVTALTFGGLDHGGNMFSGLMTVVVAVTGILVLFLGLSPFVLMGLYPAEGFSALAPAETPQTPTKPSGQEDDDEDGFDDAEAGFDDDEFEEDGFESEDGGEELFDDGYDDDQFDDDLGDFDDDDEWE